MPRKPDRRQINATVTPAQYEVIQEMAGRRGGGIAAYIRALIEYDAFWRGIEWPDDLPGRGEHPRPAPARAPRPDRGRG